MKKLPSTLPNMLCVLTLISVIAAGALAYVNKITVGPIEENKARTLAEGINSVLGVTDAQVQDTKTVQDANGNDVILYATDKGMAVQAIDPNGFGGTLKVLVGFDEAGAIKGYTVLEHAETPGLGAKADFWFQKGEKGDIIGKNPGEKELTVSKDGGDVDAITASTITSRAFLRAVNIAFHAYAGASAPDGQSGASKQQTHPSPSL
ncbi:MAG: RnfABCDGE type electron transport complex subunit G [Bacteroidaceae bacterium]|nr:RnfABCDGE type electron transport complex subunit G [Bacteroidaceae bacterium]MBQ8936834.1 RnfABCDGE type electron transport complex subunit G [Bacteroidaceae bacterium]MBR1790382.1 RnfABCDGE type electron transport complex subunit G [Bacteroidaceae bacterium]